MRADHGVQPGADKWGTMTAEQIATWKSKQCNVVFGTERVHSRALSSCKNDSSVVVNPQTYPNMSPSVPLIALMAATTTRGLLNPSTSNLALFQYLLPSFVRSLDCGYRYEVVLGYDQGDPFYDNAKVRE